jgi:phosphohistidine phosphatase
MKTLLLVRHAKSSWDLPGASDFERNLNERGKTDAPEMASRLIRKKIGVDLFMSSPAKRAKKTAEIFIKHFNRDGNEIIYIPELYLAEMDTFSEVISKLENSYQSVALFAHNPGLTDFANSLTNVHIDNIPTCGVFAVTISIERWDKFGLATKNFLFFDYPKAH